MLAPVRHRPNAISDPGFSNGWQSHTPRMFTGQDCLARPYAISDPGVANGWQSHTPSQLACGRAQEDGRLTAGGKIRAREDGRLAAGGKLAARGAGWPGQVAWATGPGVCIVAAGSPGWAGLAWLPSRLAAWVAVWGFQALHTEYIRYPGPPA